MRARIARRAVNCGKMPWDDKRAMTDLRHIRIGCMFTYLAEVPTSAVFMVRPAASAAVAMQGGRWLTDPSAPVHDYTDIYGNECARTVLPVGRSRFGFSALAVVPDATEDADEGAPEVPPKNTIMKTGQQKTRRRTRIPREA